MKDFYSKKKEIHSLYLFVSCLVINMCFGTTILAQESKAYSMEPLLQKKPTISTIQSSHLFNTPSLYLSQQIQSMVFWKGLQTSFMVSNPNEKVEYLLTYPIWNAKIDANQSTTGRNRQQSNIIPVNFYATTHNAFFCRTERKIARCFVIPVDFTLEQGQ